MNGTTLPITTQSPIIDPNLNPFAPITQPQPVEPTPPSSKTPLMSGLILACVLVILTTTAALGYAVTYRNFSLGNESLETTIAGAILSLPFTPKTPAYVLTKTLEAHTTVTRHSFDVSVAASTTDVLPIVNSPSTDFRIIGQTDYSDVKNIQSNLNITLNPDLDVDIKTTNQKLHFKVNRLPMTLFAFMNISESELQPLLQQWVTIDMTPANTPVRMQLEDAKLPKPPIEYLNETFGQELMKKEILPAVVLTAKHDGGVPVYQLHLDLTDQLLDTIQRTIETERASQLNVLETKQWSETVDTVRVDMVVDKKTFLVRSINTSIDYQTSGGLAPSTGNLTFANTEKTTETISGSLVATAIFDNFNQPVVIEPPATSLTLDELLLQVGQIIAAKQQGGAVNLDGPQGNVPVEPNQGVSYSAPGTMQWESGGSTP